MRKIMGKQTRTKKAENMGKGKVTPIQVAFIVDRYLSDNNYSQTRNIFRSEASTLISKSPVREAPKSLLSLGAILDEYIILKEQKVMLDQEKCRLEQEKLRVQTLLQGMQSAMNAYNASTGTTAPPMIASASVEKSVVTVPQSNPNVAFPPGHHVLKTSIVTPESLPSKIVMDPRSLSTPFTRNQSTNKRKDVNVPNAPLVAKKSRRQLPNRQLPNRGSDVNSQSNGVADTQEKVQQFSANQLSFHNRINNGSPAQISNVARNLFNQSSTSPQTNSSGPKTPPRALSTQSDKSMSTPDATSAANTSSKTTPQEVTPTNCTIISSKTIIVSPFKQKAYYSIERNHCISTSSPVKGNLKKPGKRDHVKGRLDFDGSDGLVSLENQVNDGNSALESEKEVDVFDIDLPNLDFSFTDLLLDFDLDCQGIDYSCQPALSSLNANSGSPQESGDHELGSNQVLSEYSSSVTEVFSEKDMNIQGLDSLTAVKSITKCIKILSPAKTS